MIFGLYSYTTCHVGADNHLFRDTDELKCSDRTTEQYSYEYIRGYTFAQIPKLRAEWIPWLI